MNYTLTPGTNREKKQRIIIAKESVIFLEININLLGFLVSFEITETHNIMGELLWIEKRIKNGWI